MKIQSNPVERLYYLGVHTKLVEFTENARVFFPQGQSKLSLIMRCLY